MLSLASLAEVEAVADELLPNYRTIPIVGCLTGLRPSELFGLERRDIDRAGKPLHVRRVLVGGNLRPYGKTAGSLRVVPLAQRALDALEAHPARIRHSDAVHDPHRRPRGLAPLAGPQLDARAPRRRTRPPRANAMRHTYASWAIAAGLPTFEIAATMGTSLEQLSKTYAHLLPDSADRARAALDAFLADQTEAFVDFAGTDK